MENGNEKQNTIANHTGCNGGKQQVQWRIVCGSDQRFYFVSSETGTAQWYPPTDVWSSKLALPYGWEAGITENNVKYYINHVGKTTTLEDPRSEGDQAIQLRMAAQRSRKVKIMRDSSLGFGFVAGSEKPVVIRSVITDGPSHGKLFSNDQILRVNGEDVSDVGQERVINLIKSSIESLEMRVVSSEDLQDAKNQGQRRSSLMSRATRERRRSSPVNVRFADDIVHYIGPAEQARRGSFPVIPNVLKVFLENGQTRSFHYNPRTTVKEIYTSLGQKLGIKSMQYFSLVLSGPQKNQLSLIQNHEKVEEIYLNRNCSRSSWVCKLRLCFLPQNPDELFDEDPIAFDYLYDQISKDIVEGHYESDLRYDLAIKLAALHMQQKATESKIKIPSKISVKTIEKDFDGLEHFVPENIINGVKLKDLRKVLDQQIKFNQSLATLGQRFLSTSECKKQYLKEARDLMSYGGKYFNVILYLKDGKSNGPALNQSKKARQQEATYLVSPRYGLSQMVKGKVNVLCQEADLEKITEFSIAYHTEGKRLLTISVNENKDTVLIMKPLDSMDLVTFIIGYQKLWKKQIAKLKIIGDTQEPLAPITDNDIPPYESIHRIIPDSWSYPSLLEVPGNYSDHNFFVDLSKEPDTAKEKPSEEVSNNDVDDNSSPLKRPSLQDRTGENSEDGIVPEKKPKSVGSVSEESYVGEVYDDKSRTLYMITEEGHSTNNDDEVADDDYITQLAFAEEMWREQRQNQSNDRIIESENAVRTLSEEEIKEDRTNEMNKDNEILDEKEMESKEGLTIADQADAVVLNGGEACQQVTDGTTDINEQQILEVPDQSEEIEIANNDGEKMPFVMNDNDELDQPTEEEFIDINDIAIDDRFVDGAETPTSLADFSFAGELFTPDLKSSTESLNINQDLNNDDIIHEHIDSNTNINSHESPENKAEDTSVDLKVDPLNPSNISSENKYFSKVLHVDELDNKVFNAKESTEQEAAKSSEKISNSESSRKEKRDARMVVYDINIDETDDANSSNDDEETGVKLISIKQYDDESITELGNTTTDSNYIERVDTNFVDLKVAQKDLDGSTNNGHERSMEVHHSTTDKDVTDSDVSSLTSSGSVIMDSNETDEQKLNNDNQRGNTTCSSVKFDERLTMVSGDLEKNMDYNTTEYTEDDKSFDGSSLSDVSDHIIEPNKEDHYALTSKIDVLIPNSNDQLLISRSTPLKSLMLGYDPGESDDTPVVEASFMDDSDKEFVDDQDLSLMDWIIPPPPGSTQELQDSDITIASPPPLSPSSCEYICSPPVGLCEKMFDESDIVGLIVPPPPLGSLDELNMVKQDFGKRLERENIQDIRDFEINTRKLDNLSLNDEHQHVEIVTLPERHPARRVHSSGSSSSQNFDFDSDSANYYSESMVSCYSLSNDSQRSSEDELFEEEPKVNLEKPLIQTITLDLKGSEYNTLYGNFTNRSTPSLKGRTENIKFEKETAKSPKNQTLSINHNKIRSKHVSNGLPFNDEDYDCFDDVVLHDHRSLPLNQNELKKATFPESLSSKPALKSPTKPNTIEEKKSSTSHLEKGGKQERALLNTADIPVNNKVQEIIQRNMLVDDSLSITKTRKNSERDAIVVDNNIHETATVTNKSQSLNPTMDAILAEQVSSKDSMNLASTSFPDYLLKQSKPKVVSKKDSVPLSEKSIQFESESGNDEQQTSNSSRSHEEKVEDTSLGHNHGEGDDSDNDSGFPNPFQQETMELTDRLKLRIQGCVEDYTQSVLKSSFSPYSNSSKWKDTMQENASRFASDIKQLNANVQEMNHDILPCIKSSQENLQYLVSSFVMASSTQSTNSLYNIRMLAGILNDVIRKYGVIIERTEESVRLTPNKKKCKEVATEAASMNALLTSLSRKLKWL